MPQRNLRVVIPIASSNTVTAQPAHANNNNNNPNRNHGGEEVRIESIFSDNDIKSMDNISLFILDNFGYRNIEFNLVIQLGVRRQCFDGDRKLYC